MLFSLLKHYLQLYITDTALKVSRSLYFFTTSISCGVENYFPRLWGMGISDAIFIFFSQITLDFHELTTADVFDCFSDGTCRSKQISALLSTGLLNTSSFTRSIQEICSTAYKHSFAIVHNKKNCLTLSRLIMKK